MVHPLFTKTHIQVPHSPMRGFTLIELMVSLTIFSILMVVSTGTLLTLIDVNAKAQALSSSATNLSFALDSITREIRTGHYYNCQEASGIDTLPGDTEEDGDSQPFLDPLDCENGSDSITFIRDRDGYKIGYRRTEVDGRGVIQQKILERDGDEIEWEDLTSSDVSIDIFSITVEDSTVYGNNGSGPGAKDQPYVLLHIEGHVNNGLETDTDFSIQTSIVQRRLDQV